MAHVNYIYGKYEMLGFISGEWEVTTREIHNLDPQPHRHCMLASKASAPPVTRCSLRKYWSHDFFQKEAGRMLPGIQACATGFAAISV